MTTDEVIRPKVEETTTEATAEKAAETTAEAAQPAAEAKAADDKASPEESAWRERVQQARARAKETERAAEEAELRITELRNQLYATGTPKDRNETAAELDAAGPKLQELRAQARAAAKELEELVAYGREKGFKEAPGPKAASEDGQPNDSYYRQRYNELREALQTAERRVQLHENRIRDLNARITNNSVSGDNFYIAQLQQDRNDELEKLEEARAARSKAQSDIEALMEEARRAGVAPGVFR
ncbi:MAG TPA: hypothetical protein VNO70_21755 [Blastocatellia bacterium]|nr:hypothetical protein [Blastocatellia bacterium]